MQQQSSMMAAVKSQQLPQQQVSWVLLCCCAASHRGNIFAVAVSKIQSAAVSESWHAGMLLLQWHLLKSLRPGSRNHVVPHESQAR